jgi:hypothetical protein
MQHYAVLLQAGISATDSVPLVATKYLNVDKAVANLIEINIFTAPKKLTLQKRFFRTFIIILLYALLTGVIFHASDVAAQPYDTLQWRPSRALNWNDFKGRVEKFSEDDALTKSSIVVSFEFVRPGHINYEIHAVFNYYGSWVKDYAKTDRLLLHEQTHFNITELFARKIRKELSETDYVPGKFKSILDEIYTKYEVEWKAYQRVYDKQTNQGVNTKAQKEWDKKVLDELELYKNYADPQVLKPIIR